MNPDKYLDWVDLVHFTLYDPYMIDILKRKKIPFIFNVYDLNHKTQNLKPGLLDLRMCDYSVEWTQALGDAADAIICISQLTKKELLHYYPTLDASKIQIIYHSIDLKKVASYQLPVTSQVLKTGNRKPVTGNYILFIGKRQAGYKNFKPLVRAVAPLLGPDLKLVCLGHMDFDEGERELFRELDIADYVQYIGWDENVKYTLLKDATCFVYPSIAEGFGIPILEARAGGCPVLCSNISVFMEVWAGAALYFDPHNIENMRELIGWVIKNKHILDNLKQSGTERVKLFDKHVELEKTVGLYKKCLAKD
jgi:glycosyltransferase involved in cell wall biosynthesis